MRVFIRNFIALLIAALATYGAGSIVMTQFVLSRNVLPVDIKTRIAASISDIIGAPLYLIVVVIGFFIAFAIAALTKRLLPSLSIIAYPVAGAVATGTALILMEFQFGFSALSGAKGISGIAAQMACGAMGGFIFEALRAKT